jgi:hypothetical protein
VSAPGPQPPRPETPRLTADEIRLQDLAQDAEELAHPVSQLKAGAISANVIAVAGADGHLFIGDGANRWERQYRGELTVADSWLTGWTAILNRRQVEAAARGVELLNVVLPEKQVVHPELRWPAGDVSGEGRPLKLLLPRLEPEARLLYGADALVNARRDSAAVWFRRNSHWNATGCCAVTAAAARALDAQADVTSIRYAYRRRPVQHDLAAHFFEPAPFETAGLLDAPVDTFFNNRLFETTGRNTGSSYGLRNPAAPDPRRLILFGDSYAYDVGFSFALAEIFAEVVFVWSKSVEWALVEQHGAQVVVWESAERFLATLPQA